MESFLRAQKEKKMEYACQFTCHNCGRSETAIMTDYRIALLQQHYAVGTSGTEKIGCYCNNGVDVFIWNNRKKKYIPYKKKKKNITYPYLFICPKCGYEREIFTNTPRSVSCKDIGCGCNSRPIFMKWNYKTENYDSTLT